MNVGNGQHTDFWNDIWCGEKSLKDQFPQLFFVCNETTKTVKQMSDDGWIMTFRRWLNVDQMIQRNVFREMLNNVNLSSHDDSPR